MIQPPAGQHWSRCLEIARAMSGYGQEMGGIEQAKVRTASDNEEGREWLLGEFPTPVVWRLLSEVVPTLRVGG